MGVDRKDAEQSAKEEYLRTGKVPVSYALKQGFLSLLRDPLLFVVGGMPGPLGYKGRQVVYSRMLKRMGKGVVIDPNVRLIGCNRLEIDDLSFLGWGCEMHIPEGSVSIGKRCHITGWVLGHAGVEIGDYVGCGGTLLSVTDSHRGGYRMSGPMIPRAQRNLRRGKIVVEKDAFIARNSTVMPGVRIGEGAIVGPFSLVMRDVKPWTVVAGVPAVKTSEREKVKFPDPD